jgi:hypothetical protein
MLEGCAVQENVGRSIRALGAGTAVLVALTGLASAQQSDCIDYGNQPSLLATLPLPAGVAAELVVLGPAAYVRVEDADGVAAWVVDWSDPAAPQIAGSLAGAAEALALGPLALYLVDGAGQLLVYGLSDPLAPHPMGAVPDTEPAVDVAVYGAHAYLVLEAGGLQAVDLADPLAPVAGAVLPLDDGNRAVAAHVGRAYVVGNGYEDHDFGLFHVVDLTIPGSPALLGSHALDGSGWGWADLYLDVWAGPAGVVVVHRDSWYDWDEDASYTYTHLRRFDVSDPTNPEPDASVTSGRETVTACLVGDLAVAAIRESGYQGNYPPCDYDENRLEVRRLDLPTTGSLLFKLPLPADPGGVAWADQHLLVAGGEAGLLIHAAAMLDPELVEPPAPVFPGQLIHGERAGLDGDRLAVSWHHEGGSSPGDEPYGTIRVFQVVDGLAVQQSSWAHPYVGLFHCLVFVGDDHLYADGHGFSMSDDQLTYLGPVPIEGQPRLMVAGFLVGVRDGGVQTWDVADPMLPAPVDHHGVGVVRDLAVQADRIAVVSATATLEMLTLADDGTLAPVGSTALPWPAEALGLDGSHVVVGNDDGDVAVFTRSPADELTLVAELQVGAEVHQIAADGVFHLAVDEIGWAVLDPLATGGPAVVGWLHGSRPVQVFADADVVVLADACPRNIWVGGQGCATDPVAVPDPHRMWPPGARLVLVDEVWPNPANPRVSVAYRLARSASVIAEIVDLAGRRVATLDAGQRAAGRHVLQWDGRDDGGRPASSGVYLVRVRANDESSARKVLLAR